MIRKTLLLMLASPTAYLWATYTYYNSDNLSSFQPNTWNQNGALSFAAGGLTATSASGGSLVSKLNVPGGNTAQEVKITYHLTASGGNYAVYLKATNDAYLGTTSTGTFYALELQNPTVTSGVCTGTLSLYKRVSGSLSLMTSTAVACKDGFTIRAAIKADGRITATWDGGYLIAADTAIASGQPGLGARGTPTGNSISLVELGAGDTTAPGAVSNPAVTALPNRVEMQWQGIPDDTNGSGFWTYELYRNGTFIGRPTTPVFADDAVSASTTYSYTVYVNDFHRNTSTATIFSVTTPPAGARDPRQVGRRPTGSYWGTHGETLDLQSGNLNFSLPVVQARSRNWSVPFALSYNSQLWRQDSAGIWNLGRDVGFGHGWILSAGTITPVWEDAYTIHHYRYTDASGAEYRLMTNSSGLWTGGDGTFVTYDASAKRLYFPDGSFWIMGAESAGTEEDSGTLHPTIMQDTNGNQLIIRYQRGISALLANSSARLTEIEDVRAVCSPNPAQCNGYDTHVFAYDSGTGQPDNRPHLTGITSKIGTGENYDFVYQSVSNLAPPFSSSLTYGPARYLQSITQRVTNLAHTFTYSTGAELTQVQTPHGGVLGWDYRNFTYQGSRTFREVYSRSLRPTSTAPLQTYTFSHDDGSDTSRSFHSRTTLADASGTADQNWLFQTTATFDQALVKTVERRTVPGSTVKSRVELTWTQTANGNFYIGTTLDTLDPGTAYSSVRKAEQTIDNYGNVIQSRLYNLNNTSTIARTYNYSYLSTTDYSSRHIRNRLSTASLTSSSQTINLMSATFDHYGALNGCPDRGAITNRTGVRQHDGTGYGSTFAARGNVSIIQAPGRTICFSHDIVGATTVGSDVDGHSSSSTFASSNNYAMPTVITPNGIAALATVYQYNTFLGVTSTTAPNTATATMSYDPQGRPQTSTSVYGAQTTYAYLDSQRQRTATVNGRVVRTTFDGFGRVTKTERLDSTNTVRSIVDTEYLPCACSPIGKLRRVSMPYAPGGTVYWTTYSYDPLGRIVSISLPNGTGTTSYLYEGNTIKVTNASARWKKYENDAFGNLSKVTEQAPTTGSDPVTNYSYSALNQLTTVTMTRGSTTQTRTFVYDSATQRLLSLSLPETGMKTFLYNNDGTVQRRTDAKNQKAEYTYDALGRVTLVKRYPSGSSTEDLCQRTSYFYDSYSPGDVGFTFQSAAGKVTSIQYGGSGCVQNSFLEFYSYYPSGLVKVKRVRHTRGAASGVLDVQYTYNNEGRLSTVDYPDAYDINSPSTLINSGGYTYSYDGLGRPSGLTEQRDRLITHAKDVTYGPANELTAITYLNQAGPGAGTDTYHTENRQYNARLQATRLTVSGVMDLEYRYSPTQNDGQILSRKDYLSGEDVAYQYDNLQRLASAATTHMSGTAPQWGQTYTYDGFGNLTGQAVTQGTAPYYSLTIDPATNRIGGVSYDANGNQTTAPLGSGSMTLSYDIENRLVNTTAGEEYSYDSSNKRVWRKKASSQEELYFYGPGGERLASYQISVSGSTLKFLELHRNIYFSGRAIRMEGQAFIADRLDSDVGGGQRYFPYGQEQTVTANDETKYGTYHRDSTTNLDYADQRYFSPQYNRFLTADPSMPGTPENTASWNMYAYVSGNPVNLNDPSGLVPATVIVDGGGGWCEPTGLMPPGGTVDASNPCPPGTEIGFGGGSIGTQSWTQQAADLLSNIDRDLITDWEFTSLPWEYDLYLTNDQYDLLSGQGFLSTGVLVQQGPRIADKVVTLGSAAIAGIIAWWTGTQANRLYTCEVRCGVHQNGTPNHAVVGTVTAIGVGTTPQQARNNAVFNANAAAAAQYGLGHHAIHCTPGKFL